MNSQILGLLVGSVLAAGCSIQDDPYTGTEIGKNNAAIDAVFADWDLPRSPGCALAVARDGTLLYSRGYGYANLDYDIPITPQTLFDVASVTKQFSAASLTMLALDGKVSLDDDVRRWLPELPVYQSPITLKHMLYHTSGLRDYLTLFPLSGRTDYYPISHDQILNMMSRQNDLVFMPGDQYVYSNTAYMLVAQVIERVSGKSLGKFTREHIFEPLGMENSLMYENLEEIIPNRAIGYGRDAAGRLRIVHNSNFDVAGDGQLYTTMADLLRWDNYLHGAKPPAIHSLMLTEGVLNNGDRIGYAQGISLQEYRGLRTVGHGGSSWGFRTALVRFIQPGLSIAVSCNSDDAAPGKLAQRVADHYLANELAPEIANKASDTGRQNKNTFTKPISVLSSDYSAFSGSFFSRELDAIYRFSDIDNVLTVRIEQEPAINIVPVGDNLFEFQFQPQGWSTPALVQVRFSRNASDMVDGFSLSAGTERNIVFTKIN